VLQEYKTRKAHIASLTASIQTKERERENLKEKMAETEGRWLPHLKKLVSQINKKYGECFARLGCVGEVALLTGEKEVNNYRVEEWRLLGCYAVCLLQGPTFQRNLAPPSSW
jgi:chromosome segregation ATPase